MSTSTWVLRIRGSTARMHTLVAAHSAESKGRTSKNMQELVVKVLMQYLLMATFITKYGYRSCMVSYQFAVHWGESVDLFILRIGVSSHHMSATVVSAFHLSQIIEDDQPMLITCDLLEWLKPMVH